MADPLSPGREELRDYLIGGGILGVSFSLYKGTLDILTVLIFVFFGLLTLLFREIGQRVVAHWMEADVELGLSQEGSVLALLVGAISYVSSFNLAFLVPVASSFSIKSHEHWGKSIDALWMKRKYWLVASGITSLLFFWTLAYSFDISGLAELVALFTFFQLLPLDEEKGLSGDLDGATILMWSGFMWLIYMGLTLIAMIMSVL